MEDQSLPPHDAAETTDASKSASGTQIPQILSGTAPPVEIKDEPLEREEPNPADYACDPDEVQEIDQDAFDATKKAPNPEESKSPTQAASPGPTRSKVSKAHDQNNNKNDLPDEEDDESDARQESENASVEPETTIKRLFGCKGRHTPNITNRMASPTLPEGKANSETSAKLGISKVIGFILPVLASLLAYVCLTSTVFSSPYQQSAHRAVNFSSILKNLQTTFPEQPKHFWSNIIASYDNSIVENRDPSIILLVHDETRAQNVTYFTKAFLNGIDQLASHSKSAQRSVDSLIYDLKSGDIPDSIQRGDDDQVKLLLDQKLVSIYKQAGRRIALLRNVQSLPGKPALLFFTYGDDESTCKFKGIILLMTFEIESARIPNYEQLVNNERELNLFVQKYLINLWRSSLNVDSQIKPLLTRIANNVLIFN